MKISLVVPVFNEQEAVPIFYKEVRSSEDLRDLSVEILFVDDGSSDNTLSAVKALAETDEQVKFISFTRNFGKEPALFAGINKATGDAIIPIDVDLQDPIDVIPQLIAKWQEGYDVVLAKRADRSSDGFLKRFSAGMFYKLHNKISHPVIEDNVGDFRLLSRKTVDRIKKLKERNLFMKGVLSWPGGKTAVIEYVRCERSAGHTKFNGWKLWNLAIEGITSFSTVPLRFWSYIGFSVASLAFAYGAWMIADKLIWGNQVQGYPSLMVSILFFGGIQLIGIGVLGEYIGRIYIETKARPTYLIEEEN
ncbi:glycosyltransferase family 2 protein [Pseudomonas putida]|uniref:Glycosyltransferase n=1 Tax=Pseudomonas putida TaxID=303 RepID=A0A1X0ZT90_PSEPU|nr:glycosyltransferase family 2 protein [Pseudomonas putida]ORL62917.1 glycosyltransferase [Pseudomonas putida]